MVKKTREAKPRKVRKVEEEEVLVSTSDEIIEEEVEESIETPNKVTTLKVEEEVIEEVQDETAIEPSAELTPEQQWELSVKEKINEYVDNFLSVSKECNMGTRYFNPVMEVYETHTDYYEDRTNGAELRIVFAFDKDLDLKDMNFT